MQPLRLSIFARSLFLIGALLSAGTASFASGSATVSLTVLDAANQPVGGARVLFTGSTGSTFTAYTDRNGRASMTIPDDTYSIVASRTGYSTESLNDMEIAANAKLSITLSAAIATPSPSPAPPARPLATPVAIARATPSPSPSARPTPTPAPTPSAPPAPPASPVARPTPSLAAVVRPTPVAAATPVLTLSPAPTPAPVALLPPATQPPQRTPVLVHDALLATYDARHPEHVAGEPYFGRYTYVLLLGAGADDPRNLAMLEALALRLAPVSSNQMVAGNPLGYNAFFLPVKGGARNAQAAASPAELLAQYDFKTARYLRDRYCASPAHAESSICEQPAGQGPIMLTLTRPLQGLQAKDPFPATFGYDFSVVSTDQFATAIPLIAIIATVPGQAQPDVELPPADLSKYVGPAFVTSGAALRKSVPSLRVSVDNGLLG